MREYLRKAVGYGIYILLSNLIYGIILFFSVTWLLQFSELYAYLGNLVFIFLALLIDRLILTKILQPKKLVHEIKKLENLKDKELNNRLIHWQLNYFVSFKTSLFFFYIFVLLFSQILKFNPNLVSPEIAGFINSIDYSVIILLALKDFNEEFYKDREHMNIVLEQYDQLVKQD